MKITVAIACYNLEDRIAICLESVITQNYQDLEILVVDDHSSDRSVEIVRDMIRNHPEREFRLIVNEENLGLNKVRNISIDEASGEAIFFMDGDDTIEPGTLSLFQRRMEDTGVEVVSGSFRKTDLDGNTLLSKQFPEDTIIGDFALATYIEKHVKGFFWLVLWNRLYRLDFLRLHNIRCATNYRKHELCLFTFKVALHARSISYINDITYNWCNVSASITNGIRRNRNLLADLRTMFGSLIDARNEFLYGSPLRPAKGHGRSLRPAEQTLPPGINFLLNYVILTQGFLKDAIQSDLFSRREKRHFLKWLRKVYKENGMNKDSVVGPYNRLSYLILVSPFPYSLFRFYYRHLKTIVKIINSFIQ